MRMREKIRSLSSPWRDLRWVFGAIWLFFLGYPTTSILQSAHSPVVKAVGVALVVLFVVVYTGFCVYVMAPVMSDGFDDAAPLIPAWYFIVIMAVIAAVLTIPLGEDVFVFAPYFVGVMAFSFSMVTAVSAVAAFLLAMVLLPEWIPGWSLDTSLASTVTISSVVMLMMKVIQTRRAVVEEAERERRKFSEQIAVAAERERVARDVHDLLGHSLTVLTVKSELAARLIDIDASRAKAELTDINDITRRALAEVRATVGNLRTPELCNEIASARTALVAAQINADLPSPESVAENPTFAWVLREAVTNVVRHSCATCCRVSVGERSLTVTDNGRGIGAAAFGNGLAGLSSRVANAGGTLEVAAAHGGGTVVRVRMS